MNTRIAMRLVVLSLLAFAFPSVLPAQDVPWLCVGTQEDLGSVNFHTGGAHNFGGFSLTADGKTMVYDSWGGGAQWIFITSRDDTDEPFAGGERLGPEVNDGSMVFGPRISPDGRAERPELQN